uniref:Uncharacterized protein n=1 Tax=Acrobeloides nanus TaxID=290746 RepID=A0A914BZN3_9BILA
MDAEPKILITLNIESDRHFQEKLPYVVDEFNLQYEASNFTPELENECVSGDDVASMVYTSGTTGLPKGAMITHSGLASNAEALVDCWRFSQDDVLLHTLPFYHIHGMFVSLNCTFFSRSTAIFRPKFDVEDVMYWLPKSTVFMGVPTFYSRLLKSDKISFMNLKNIRLFVSGSAPLSMALWDEFYKQTGHKILERYGMSETLIITSNPYEEHLRKPGSVGVPVPGCQVRISDNGIIECKSTSLFKGYWKLPEKTKKEFTEDGFFVTGDVGKFDEDGQLYILGRDKDMIISGGLNIYPKQIEDVLDSMDSVKESAVIGVPHPDFGEVGIAICVPNNFATDKEILATNVLREAKQKLSNYKVPKKVIIAENLPRNSMGKVQKKELREEYKNLFQSNQVVA